MLNISEQAERAMLVSPSTRRRLFLKGSELVTDDGSERFPVRGSRAIFVEAHRDSPMHDEYWGLEGRGWLGKLKSSIPYLIRSRAAERAVAQFDGLTAGHFVL